MGFIEENESIKIEKISNKSKILLMSGKKKEEEGIKIIDRRRFVLKEDGSVDKRETEEKSKENIREDVENEKRIKSSPDYGKIPPVDFQTFISTLATNALIHLGHLPEPSTGQQVRNLDVARYHIDVIDMLKEKTKGNLSSQEEEFLKDILSDLKLRFFEESQKNK